MLRTADAASTPPPCQVLALTTTPKRDKLDAKGCAKFRIRTFPTTRPIDSLLKWLEECHRRTFRAAVRVAVRRLRVAGDA